MADYKRGDRVLVHDVDDKGKKRRNAWYVATVVAVGRNRNEGSYRVKYDDNTTETVPLDDILGRTPIKRQRRSLIQGADQIAKWKVETRKATRIKEDRRKQGLTARQLTQNVPNFVRINSSYVSVQTQLRKRKEGNFYTILGKSRTAPAKAGDTASKHQQRVDILEEGTKDPKSKGARLKVSCTCENWVFMWEFAAAKYGGADIIFGNGDPPIVTNPRHVVGCCKHLYRMLG